jgi:DNA-binding CsgD family transcriptional regulator
MSTTRSALPLVGRTAELAELRAALDALGHGRGGVWLVAGEGGVGKTRLGRALMDEATRRGLHVASGRAFPVESGVPYALFADALLPVVRRMPEDALAVLTRGVGELSYLFPLLPSDSAPRPRDTESTDFRSRLHWHFTQFLRGLVAKQPLVVVLEDLQWADTSSLELLHFVVRQMNDAPLFLYCTFNPDQPEPNVALRAMQQSLGGMGLARQRKLEPLDEDAVGELLNRMFGADRTLTRDFATLLYRWTRGNPFFVEETLKALTASGDLRQEDGRWTGWHVDALRLPASVREAVLTRLEVLSTPAREAADIAAVLGGRFSFDRLAATVSMPADTLLDALDELTRARVLEEVPVDDDVVYDFMHPLLRETLYSELGRIRLKLLHGRVAEALERHHGVAAAHHADELAYHFARAQSADAIEKAILYLTRAGLQALRRSANREAADYLAAALERMQQHGSDPEAIIDVAEALAQARQRLGEYDVATELWTRVQQWALSHGEPLRAAAVARRMGLACYWKGALGEALRHLEAGIAWVAAAGTAASGDGAAPDTAHAVALRVRLGTAKAACLQELGRFDDALVAAEEAMQAAGAEADPALLVRIHRTFLQLHLWRGDARLAREHGTRALELAAQQPDRTLAFMAYWAMGVLEAFAGNTEAFDRHLAEAMRLADELHSPVLRAWAAELAVEYASARGDWDEALSVGEEAISMARALQQWTLLPRLLVWTGLIHLGRSEIERGEAYVEEAWRVSGAGGSDAGANVHAVIPAYIGRAGVCLARGDHRGAVRLGEQALEIADRTGYIVWGVHHLLPVIAESYLWVRDLEGAQRTGERLRRDAERLGHRMGLAWADACDALVAWLGGDSARGAVLLREAAEQLEAVPFMPDATRLRRQLAGRLAEIGEKDEAVRELRLVHDRLLSLGMEAELAKARAQFREMGLRPPPRGAGRTQGGSVLTDREAAIADLVARRKSTKAIAGELSISRRTVEAHLTNIYRKLDIHTRGDLADMVRTGRISDED